MIIHVSGTTGSGKTYLGNFMSQLYKKDKLLVIDLDDMFHRLIESLKPQDLKDPSLRVSKIQMLVDKYVNMLRGKHKNILFVGYSDIVVGDKPQYIDLGAQKRYFIDIPLTVLVKQYKDRASQHILSTRREIRVLGMEDLRKMVRVDRQLYSKYKWLPQKEIMKEIILLLGK